MVSERTKRKFWQIHLSTAVLMTLTAAGFLWCNCVQRSSPVVDDGIIPRSGIPAEWKTRSDVDFLIGFKWYGWPFMVVVTEPQFDNSHGPLLSGRGIAANAAIGVVALFAVALACESVARRREGRRP